MNQRRTLHLLLFGLLLTIGAPGRAALGDVFQPVGSMTEGRFGPRATLLADGTVLITGGSSLRNRQIGALASAERFDPATNRFTAVGPMAEKRNDSHAAVRLNDGRVLVVGGTFTKTAELYDPATQKFSPAGFMQRVRGGPTATLMEDGRVLVTGGWDGTLKPPTAELYDPAIGKFTAAGEMGEWRYWHAAIRLRDGRVLVAGGFDKRGPATRSIEVYDPKTNSFSQRAEMVEARVFPTVALLPDGRVLIAGGSYTNPAGDPVGVRKSVEVFDPATGQSTIQEGMLEPRLAPLMVTLRDGRILLAGGQVNGRDPNQLTKAHIQNSAELLDPTTGKTTAAPAMSVPRSFPAGLILPDGRVLVAGGISFSDRLHATETAEVFVP